MNFLFMAKWFFLFCSYLFLLLFHLVIRFRNKSTIYYSILIYKMHSIRKRNINSCAERWRWQWCWLWQSKYSNDFFLFSHAHGTMREEWTKCVDWMKKNGNVPTHSKGPRCFGSHLKMTLAQVNLLFVHSLDSNFMFATPLIFSETHIVMEW